MKDGGKADDQGVGKPGQCTETIGCIQLPGSPTPPLATYGSGVTNRPSDDW
jgi:hypothetical protein